MSDKVLLVTGASSDVGIKLIREIYSEYETIYLHYGHMNDSFKQLTDEISGDRNVILLQADFSKEEDVDKMMELIDDNKVMPNNIIHISAPRIAIKHFLLQYMRGWIVFYKSIGPWKILECQWFSAHLYNKSNITMIVADLQIYLL